MKVYLDHNIYIECLTNSSLQDFIVEICDENKAVFFYSPAHVEEIYRVAANGSSAYKNKMNSLVQLIERITNAREILPATGGLQFMYETISMCYKRVSEFDTRDFVQERSLQKYTVDNEFHKYLGEQDKHNLSISNLSAVDIWECPLLKDLLNEWNMHCSDIIQRYNHRADVAALLMAGIDTRLPKDFSIERGMYKTRLKNSHSQLEYTIEFLMKVLNFYGYNADKKEKTAVSGTHDISHCIYATAADLFLSMDHRFMKKCEAVYYYLGVDTKVCFCKDAEEVKRFLQG